MRNAAENRISEQFILIGVVRKEPDGIGIGERLHLVNAGRSAVQGILLGKQFLFNKTHSTAAENNHHILMPQLFIPQHLKDGRNAFIDLAGIRELVDNQ